MHASIQTEQFTARVVSSKTSSCDGGRLPRVCSIDRKITDLFVRRGVWIYAQETLDPERFTLWTRVSKALQRRIYHLDDYYETTAILGGKREYHFWRNLEGAARLLPSVPVDSLHRTISDLREYASDEARIHAGVGFDRAEWLSITYRKSADVSLARELAFDLMGARAPSVRVRQFLRLYDQVMEVLEDLDDVHEDCYDWNLNFWLTPIRQGVTPRTAASDMHSIISELCRMAQVAWDRLDVHERLAHVSFWNDLRRLVSMCRKQKHAHVSLLMSIGYIPYNCLR